MSKVAAAVAAIIAVGVCGCGLRSVNINQPSITGVRPVADMGNPAGWARAQARALAKRMLAVQPLPPHARPLRPGQARPAGLQPAARIGGRESSVDISRMYLVGMPEAAVVTFFYRHARAGAANLGYGSDSAERLVYYMLTSRPAGVCGTLFVASMLPATGGGTWLRTDAQAVWCLPRSAAEHIDPGKFRAVVVKSANLNLPRVTKRFTSGRVIAELARKLNAMPISAAAGDFCPEFAGGYRLVFEPRPGAARRVVVTAEPCDSVLVSVGGSKQPALADTTRLGALVDRLLAVG